MQKQTKKKKKQKKKKTKKKTTNVQSLKKMISMLNWNRGAWN